MARAGPLLIAVSGYASRPPVPPVVAAALTPVAA